MKMWRCGNENLFTVIPLLFGTSQMKARMTEGAWA
jgi:hypothetical protein